MLHRLLIGFLNTSLSNNVQKTSKIGQFLWTSKLYDPNIKKLMSDLFSFGIYANITLGKKLKICQGRPHLLSGRFIRVIYKMNTFPRRPLFSDPKSGRLIQVWLSLFQSVQLMYCQSKRLSRQSLFTLLFVELLAIYFFSKSFLLPFNQCFGA